MGVHDNVSSVGAKKVEKLAQLLPEQIEGLELDSQASRELDIDHRELNGGYRFSIDTVQDGVRYVEIYLFDTLVGGAGYAVSLQVQQFR